MKATIQIERGSYGFGHTWTLTLTKSDGTYRAFYLGQDVKFCSRVLGMSPRYIVEQIGSNDLTKETTRTRLANFILGYLGVTKNELYKQEAWSLCAE
jgi:hypothetical protein